MNPIGSNARPETVWSTAQNLISMLEQAVTYNGGASMPGLLRDSYDLLDTLPESVLLARLHEFETFGHFRGLPPSQTLSLLPEEDLKLANELKSFEQEPDEKAKLLQGVTHGKAALINAFVLTRLGRKEGEDLPKGTVLSIFKGVMKHAISEAKKPPRTISKVVADFEQNGLEESVGMGADSIHAVVRDSFRLVDPKFNRSELETTFGRKYFDPETRVAQAAVSQAVTLGGTGYPKRQFSSRQGTGFPTAGHGSK